MTDEDKKNKNIKEIILYLLFGGATTLVSIISFYVLYSLIKLPLNLSNILSWIFSVSFAYITNRNWVFGSRVKGLRKIISECLNFFSGRIGTGLFEIISIYLLVEFLKQDAMLMKIIVTCLVIILNYIISKLFVFRKSS